MNQKDVPQDTDMLRSSAWLWILFGLFCLRVLGQVLVVFFGVTWLPPPEEWFSGALTYPCLLASQVIIIGLLAQICVQFSRNRGFWVRPSRRLARGFLAFGTIYFTTMVIRYTVRMSLYPHERWTGGSIPIFFHWVLALFVLTVGIHGSRTTNARSRSLAIPRRAITTRVLGFVGVAVLLFVWTIWLLMPTLFARSIGARGPEFAVRVHADTRIRMSDGIELSSEVFVPRRAGQVPTILVRLPYDLTLTNTLFAKTVGRFWAERGYAVLLQGTRGRYRSGGTAIPFGHELDDGTATLNWIRQQPWSNGKIGMWGGSYFGYTQWVLADRADLGLKAFVLQICSSSFHDMFYPGGAFALESALTWAMGSHGTRNTIPAQEKLAKGYDHWPLIEADDRVEKDVPFFNEWVTHPESGAYWTEIDGAGRPAKISAPALLMAGWYDPFLPFQLNDFVRIKSRTDSVGAKSCLVVGPWAHARAVSLPGGYKGRNYRIESLAPSLDWFDALLRNPRNQPTMAPVRIFVMGRNVWRDEQEWPLARTGYATFYLDGDGQMTATDRVSDSRVLTYVYDPENPVPSIGGAVIGPRAGTYPQTAVGVRSDVLSFQTSVLEKDTEVTGPVRVVLYVRTSAPNTDFTANLLDVHPDGTSFNICEGILRRSYDGRRGPVEIQIDLWPTSQVFFGGHRIRLDVSSSNFPRFDRNPNTEGDIARETAPVKASQEIFVGGFTPSRLILPLIPSDERIR